MRRGLCAAMVLAALIAPGSARAAVSLVTVGTFASPTYVTAPPGDASRVVVVEQAGTVRLLRDGAVQPRPFADLTARVLSGGERGLLSIAFAPDYATSGLLYAYFTNRSGDIEVDELRRSASDADVVEGGYARTVLTVGHRDASNHNGGQLQFGPDGALYAGTGDGGGAGDPNGNAQNDAGRLGKLLRLDLAGGATALAKGLRNPWRFSFDRATGDLVVADVGQGAVEEVDFAAAPGLGAGANYGWDRYEGDSVYDSNVTIAGTVTPPVLVHRHSDGWCSITGGYVVRDPDVPELAGRYVYGDYCKGALYSATLPDGRDDAPVGLTVPSLSSFGEDAAGRVYVASLNGAVYRLAGSGRPSSPPGESPPPAPGTANAEAGAPSASPVVAGATLRLGLDAGRRVVRASTGRVRLVVTCSQACPFGVRAAVFGARATRLTRGLPAGRSVVVLRLSRAARAALRRSLRRGRRPTVGLHVSAGGVARTVRLRVVG